MLRGQVIVGKAIFMRNRESLTHCCVAVKKDGAAEEYKQQDCHFIVRKNLQILSIKLHIPFSFALKNLSTSTNYTLSVHNQLQRLRFLKRRAFKHGNRFVVDGDSLAPVTPNFYFFFRWLLGRTVRFPHQSIAFVICEGCNPGKLTTINCLQPSPRFAKHVFLTLNLKEIVNHHQSGSKWLYEPANSRPKRRRWWRWRR